MKPNRKNKHYQENIVRPSLTNSNRSSVKSPPNYQSPPTKPAITKITWLYRLLILGAAFVLLVGLVVSGHDWLTNRQVVQTAKKAIAQANNGQSSPAPSTVKPSATAVATYSVAPDKPLYLIIPKLSVQARVYPVGLTSSGAIGTPNNVYDTDWYTGSSLPGQPGAMLIDGHISSWTTHGVFYGLKILVAGDTIQVERGDKSILTYKVVKSQIYNSNNVDMTAALTPIVAGQPGLNLISCTGDVISGTSEFNERIVVFATQISS